MAVRGKMNNVGILVGCLFVICERCCLPQALLGTYRCTDVPGQFEWQAGSLTQAVTAGHWILLEDLDYAPMDVVSMLVPLLEGNTLSVPGHGDVIKADPGFRLFATQR